MLEQLEHNILWFRKKASILWRETLRLIWKAQVSKNLFDQKTNSISKSKNWFSFLIRKLVQIVNQKIYSDCKSDCEIQKLFRLWIRKLVQIANQKFRFRLRIRTFTSDCESGQLKSATGGEEAKDRLQQQNRLFCPTWFPTWFSIWFSIWFPISFAIWFSIWFKQFCQSLIKSWLVLNLQKRMKVVESFFLFLL